MGGGGGGSRGLFAPGGGGGGSGRVGLGGGGGAIGGYMPPRPSVGPSEAPYLPLPSL